MSTDTQSIKDRIAELLEKTPGQMTPILARQVGVPESELLALWPNDDVVELDGTRSEEIIRELENLGRVHVICRNDAVVLEAYGEFGQFSNAGPFLNVQTKSLDMHIQHRKLVRVFSMIKPSHQDGQKTYSIQFFQADGTSGFKVFLYKSVTEESGAVMEDKIEVWRSFQTKFPKQS